MEPRGDYPRPRIRRSRWVNLNGWWEFGSGEEARFDRRILVPFAPQAALSGIGERAPGDVVWYRRRFAAPAAERLLLHFGAIDYWATIWVNGVEVARHQGGHTPFTADLTGVAAGPDNVLVVRARDPLTDRTIPRGKQYWGPHSESIFYTPTTGIWQTVWLEPLPAEHIQAVRVWPDLDSEAVELEIAAAARAASRVEVAASLDGREVGRWAGPPGRIRLSLTDVQPWSPESPRLYDLDIRLLGAHGRVTDHVTSYFGLRKVETRHGQFLLNGRPYVQRLVLDQGYFPGGLLTAATDDDLRRDIELAKALGFNGARKHQKIEDPRWLYWADVLGLLVWAEMPNAHEPSAEAESRLADEWSEAVRRDRDHPCVVAWVPVNESFGIWQPSDPAAQAAFQVRLHRLTRRLDQTRPVVSNDGWKHAITDLCTLHDYSPAEDMRRRYRSLESTLSAGGRSRAPYLSGFAYRGEPILVSEFGGVAQRETGGWGYSTVSGSRDFLETYGAMIDALMDYGPVQGFCYTQLTDVEQERNGLLTFEREPKVPPELIAPLTQTPKRD